MKTVPHQITEFGTTTKEAMHRAMERLAEEHDTRQGCQAVFWVGLDRESGRPVCRVTYLVVTE